jgi:hypothetical protein
MSRLTQTKLSPFDEFADSPNVGVMTDRQVAPGMGRIWAGFAALKCSKQRPPAEIAPTKIRPSLRTCESLELVTDLVGPEALEANQGLVERL